MPLPTMLSPMLEIGFNWQIIYKKYPLLIFLKSLPIILKSQPIRDIPANIPDDIQ